MTTAPDPEGSDRLQVFLRYGSGFETHDATLSVGQYLSCFLRLVSPDRITALVQQPNPMLSEVRWEPFVRPDRDGGERPPGWRGTAAGIDVFSISAAPPSASTATCWTLRHRQWPGSSSWFPDSVQPATGTITQLDEISLIVDPGLATGIDRWVLESAVIRPVGTTSPAGLLEKADRDDGRTLVVISVLLAGTTTAQH